jgi:uncharacterized repeat protein (TIGR01451 family)
LTIAKSASPTTYSYVGQEITYTYVVTNTGNVKIKGPIKVTDDKIGVLTVSTSSLESGKSITKTTTYKIKQADLISGSVTNKASVTGYFNNKLIKSNDATATVTVSKPALKLEKSASPATYDAVGQTITYKYAVTNTGNVAISGPIKITDNKIGTFTISDSNLASGTSVEGTATYKILPADLTAGSVTNTAHATGTFSGKDITSEEVTATVTSTKTPPPDTQIPEFPSIALPVASILGLMFISQYRRKEK